MYCKNVLDVANVGPFGICSKCVEPDYFKCAGTRDIEKKDIIEGNLHFTLFKNPNALMYDDNIPNIEWECLPKISMLSWRLQRMKKPEIPEV